MIKFEIKNRNSKEVKFIAEIECEESLSYSFKSRLDVEWALKNKIDLTNSDLRGSNLSGAKLDFIDLTNVDLTGANLSGANLRNTILKNTNLSDTIINGADLYNADLTNTNLHCVKLSFIDHNGVYLGNSILDE